MKTLQRASDGTGTHSHEGGVSIGITVCRYLSERSSVAGLTGSGNTPVFRYVTYVFM